MNLQKSKTNLAKHDPYIKFIDRHGQTYIYVANIDVLAQEYERRTGHELCWKPAPVLYFYHVWAGKKSRKINGRGVKPQRRRK